jgi:hypothetical protein
MAFSGHSENVLFDDRKLFLEQQRAYYHTEFGRAWQGDSFSLRLLLARGRPRWATGWPPQVQNSVLTVNTFGSVARAKIFWILAVLLVGRFI